MIEFLFSFLWGKQKHWHTKIEASEQCERRHVRRLFPKWTRMWACFFAARASVWVRSALVFYVNERVGESISTHTRARTPLRLLRIEGEEEVEMWQSQRDGWRQGRSLSL